MEKIYVPRFLDSKQTVLGMEIEELFVATLIFVIFFFIDKLILGLLLAGISAFIMKKWKAGKPDAYLIHKLYFKFGIPLPGLLPPYVKRFEV